MPPLTLLRLDPGRVHGGGNRGYTLIELAVTLAIIVGLAFIVFPVMSKCHETTRQSACSSNEKQIGLALLGYIQDYDQKFPPATGYYRAPEDGLLYPSDWGPNLTLTVSGISRTIPGEIEPYIKNPAIFACPDYLKTVHGPAQEHATYMYNDLAAGSDQRNFSAVARTVLVAEGEDQFHNVGHAWEPDQFVHSAAFTPQGNCVPGHGATVKDAPRRHSDGANYLLSDGHVKWFKSEAVFFPPRTRNERSSRDRNKNPIGPDLEGNMSYQGRTYRATFHIR